ncbi:MAG: glycoside hydrolase family 57 [Deltaproteobacteria bacterium]|nr:glycoside hydrolase family 57 [Deltaproteobacteria bacterium]
MAEILLRLYAIFHLNLTYSSIEEEERSEVLRNCYWPLLHLAREYNLPFGIEATGHTLEMAAAIDPAWVEELRRLTTEGPCEFIGSGYAQIIGPLVPAQVNDWNQKIGKDTYEKNLGIKPKIAIVNEMAYSAGMVECYLNNGYQSIIMEWNNPRRYHPEWRNEWRYFPQKALGADCQRIPVIWADSIAFQKFQRYAHGEYNLDEYIEYLKSHDNGSARYFPIYANDVEIFDFRPRRYKTEADLVPSGEWTRIAELFKYLKKDGAFRIISPSEVLKGLKNKNGGQTLTLESPEQPIPVKKQEKYNINRWALTGKDDLCINTKCYRIYDAFKKAKSNKPEVEDWKELCSLWSSDFRTHITQKRWDSYLPRLDRFCEKWQSGQKSLFVKPDNQVIEPPYLYILISKVMAGI